MLTGSSEVTGKVLGLRFGADNYVTKPFDIEELSARVGAVIRRVYGSAERSAELCGIKINFMTRAVTLKGAPVELTRREFDLLRVFMRSPDIILTREILIPSVCRNAALNDSKAVGVTVMNLRRELGGAGSPICAIRLFGYKLASQD